MKSCRLQAISCQAEKQPGRNDAHRKPPLPHLTGSWSYGRVVLFSFSFFFFVHCLRRFVASVPFEQSCPFYQGTKVSTRTTYFPCFPSPSIILKPILCQVGFVCQWNELLNSKDSSTPIPSTYQTTQLCRTPNLFFLKPVQPFTARL